MPLLWVWMDKFDFRIRSNWTNDFLAVNIRILIKYMCCFTCAANQICAYVRLCVCSYAAVFLFMCAIPWEFNLTINSWTRMPHLNILVSPWHFCTCANSLFSFFFVFFFHLYFRFRCRSVSSCLVFFVCLSVCFARSAWPRLLLKCVYMNGFFAIFALLPVVFLCSSFFSLHISFYVRLCLLSCTNGINSVLQQ